VEPVEHHNDGFKIQAARIESFLSLGRIILDAHGMFSSDYGAATRINVAQK